MSNEEKLRRRLLWATLLSFTGVALSVTLNSTVGAVLTISGMAALAQSIHKFGRLRDD